MLLAHLRTIGPVAALVALVVALVPTGAGANPAPVGTPVLGPSMLSADQIAAWYASTGIRSRSPTDVGVLARIFVDEGAAQGVRADIAFAQSMVETGYLRYGGQVLPSDHNFSGLGACDSCRRGLAFASPVLGVRAQIQHLWAYASPTASANATARPNVDIRFDLVRPKGRAPLWETMGAGNWATDPDYAGKVLSVYRSMLRFAGVSPPSPTTAPATGLRAARTLRVSTAGAAVIGTWMPHRAPIARAQRAFGAPQSSRQGRAGCLLRWSDQGITVLTDGPCASKDTMARWVRLSSGWSTQRGLGVGDPIVALNRLYPGARTRGVQRWLVSGRDPGSRILRPRLRAEIRNGQVRALVVNVRPAPQ
jgi:hypothetical protein